MPVQPRFWDGRTVQFASKGLGGIYDARCWDLGLTEETARQLALTLAKAKLTYFALPPAMEELLNALNYVLVADPASVAAHRRMEAEKGMTPDGGYRRPEGTSMDSGYPSAPS